MEPKTEESCLEKAGSYPGSRPIDHGPGCNLVVALSPCGFSSSLACPWSCYQTHVSQNELCPTVTPVAGLPTMDLTETGSIPVIQIQPHSTRAPKALLSIQGLWRSNIYLCPMVTGLVTLESTEDPKHP